MTKVSVLNININSANDLILFSAHLNRVATRNKFVAQNLGMVGNEPLLLFSPEKLNKGPNVLVSAGFHGEEPAGCWGILRFLEEYYPKIFEKINISFLPLVNPTGFRRGARRNDWNENPNDGFCHTSSGKPEPSREGQILLNHIDQIKMLAKDGFVSLHEDFEQDKFYLYTFEHANAPGKFSTSLRSELAAFFDPVPDGMIEGAKACGGIIFNSCDSSFEDFLFHEGISLTACTETPGLLEISKRIEANSHVIHGLVEFSIANHIRRFNT